MATFAFKNCEWPTESSAPKPYTYVPTPPRSKSTAARRKPASEQSSILNKHQRSKLSEAELSTPQPAAANDIGGDKLGIRETSTINDGDDNENDDYYDPPSIEQLLYTTLQKEGFAAEDQRPNNTAFGVGDITAEERGGSLDDNRSAPGDNSSGSPEDPIVLLGDDDSSASEAEADDGGPRAESAAADEGLLDSPETAIDSTTPDQEEPQEQQGEKRRHQDGAEEASSGNHQSEGNERSHDTGDEDDEEPRLAKRRKLPLVSTDVALTPPLEHSPKPCLRQPHGLAPSSTTQPEMDESPPPADHGHLSTPGDDEHHYTPPTSRSPSVTVESAPVAEYREWPFEGFLKRITIGNQTTYNLEFALPRIPEHLDLSLHSEVLGAGSKESSAEAVVSHKAVASRKPGKELTKEQESLLAKMVHEDETWTEIGRHFPGHTLQSLKENFFTKQGGRPRKRGRKPGVRSRGA